MGSIGGAFGGNRGLTPLPPEKGVFPLDHFHECDEAMKVYMQCLKKNQYDSQSCRSLSKVYLECRMEKSLMAKQDLKQLGFKDGQDVQERSEAVGQAPAAPSPADRSREKLRGGFVSGIPKSSGRQP